MNIQDAISAYMANERAENIVRGTTVLIGDKGTGRVFLLNGGNFYPSIEDLASNEWEVLENS
jgi:hypothetical protein